MGASHILDKAYLQPLILGAILHHDVLFQGVQPRHLCLYVVHHCLQRCPVAGLCLLMQVVDVHVVWNGHLQPCACSESHCTWGAYVGAPLPDQAAALHPSQHYAELNLQLWAYAESHCTWAPATTSVHRGLLWGPNYEAKGACMNLSAVLIKSVLNIVPAGKGGCCGPAACKGICVGCRDAGASVNPQAAKRRHQQACSSMTVRWTCMMRMIQRAKYLSVCNALQEVCLAAAIGSKQPISAPNGELYAAVRNELHAIQTHAEAADLDVS